MGWFRDLGSGLSRDVLRRTPPVADYRLQYGVGEFQFGELFLPKGELLAPVVVFLHGGWWRSEFGLGYGGHLCAAMKAEGVACWSLEYRRMGNAGGGWPGTFEDVAAGYDYLTALARVYPLDLRRVMVVGHSAGGQLGLWLAGRLHLPAGGVLMAPAAMLPMRGVVALAGVVDLRLMIDLAGHLTFAADKRWVEEFMGGKPEEVPERYRAGNPGELLPLNVVQVLLQGTEDDQIPRRLPARWVERGRRMGEKVTVEMIAGADHFDLVDPLSKAWPRVLAAIKRVLL